MNPGILVEWTKNGKKQKGVVYNNEQQPEIDRMGKYLIVLLNDDLSIMHNSQKQEIRILKSKTLVNLIGYID